ncbi:MAG: glycerol-3-phosphate acyltransferase [Ilumatobacteraceae bacterium]
MSQTVVVTGLAIVVGYLVGSIPSAFLVGRAVAAVDVRREGEGNVGARNVFHVVGARWGVVVFVADVVKGIVVVLAFSSVSAETVAVAATAALVGHGYPVWLGFRGGKGLSTAGGATLALMPWAAGVGIAAAGIMWSISRRFLPTTVVLIVATIAAAPLIGVGSWRVALVVWLFVLTGVKRMLDEPTMRAVEASTGWDRARGMRS